MSPRPEHRIDDWFGIRIEPRCTGLTTDELSKTQMEYGGKHTSCCVDASCSYLFGPNPVACIKTQRLLVG